MPAPGKDDDRERPDALGAGDSGGENAELGQILSVIAEEVNRHCSTVCAGINADFAARAANARRTLPRYQVAAALQAFKQARQAALELARQAARMELQGRKEAAIVLHGRQRPRSTAGGRSPWGGSPRQGPK
jgi:hypothetical protein